MLNGTFVYCNTWVIESGLRISRNHTAVHLYPIPCRTRLDSQSTLFLGVLLVQIFSYSRKCLFLMVHLNTTDRTKVSGFCCCPPHLQHAPADGGSRGSTMLAPAAPGAARTLRGVGRARGQGQQPPALLLTSQQQLSCLPH